MFHDFWLGKEKQRIIPTRKVEFESHSGNCLMLTAEGQSNDGIPLGIPIVFVVS